MDPFYFKNIIEILQKFAEHSPSSEIGLNFFLYSLY